MLAPNQESRLDRASRIDSDLCSGVSTPEVEAVLDSVLEDIDARYDDNGQFCPVEEGR